MNEYYNNLLNNLLKEDIIQFFDKIKKDEDNNIIIQSVIDDYVKNNKLVFKEDIELYNIRETKSGGHIYRDRVKYINKDNRCIARVWNMGMGGQCSFTGNYECFCKKHYNKGGNDWFLGTINQDRPERPMNNKGKFLKWVN